MGCGSDSHALFLFFQTLLLQWKLSLQTWAKDQGNMLYWNKDNPECIYFEQKNTHSQLTEVFL